jgi:threonine synthase
VAAAVKLRKSGVIGKDDVVVCNLTGHGLKQPEAIRIPQSELQPIAPTLDALREKLRKGGIDI